MRIGLLAPPWIPVPPPAYGGTENVIYDLARELVRQGHDVVLFGHAESCVPGVTLIGGPGVPPDVQIGAAPYELEHAVEGYECLLAHGVDVIHDHTVVGPIIGRGVEDRPVIITNHGPFTRQAVAVYRAVSPPCRLVALSHAHARNAPEGLVDTVIHHGLDVADFPFGQGEGGYFVFLGRFAPEKGAAVAARAALDTGVELVIAAKMWEPSERRYFEDEVKPLLSRKVRFVGEVDRETKKRLLADAVALVNPISWPEPFGMTMIEAAACGTPVITFPFGAAVEIVEPGRSGVLCADYQELVRAIRTVHGIDRAQCREVAAHRFSAARMARDHLDLYGAPHPLEAATATNGSGH